VRKWRDRYVAKYGGAEYRAAAESMGYQIGAATRPSRKSLNTHRYLIEVVGHAPCAAATPVPARRSHGPDLRHGKPAAQPGTDAFYERMRPSPGQQAT